MVKGDNRRRHYFIKKDFQAKFIFRFCLLVVIGSVISGIIVYLFCGRTVTTSFVNSKLVVKNTADYILPALLFSGLGVAAIVAFAAGALALFTSHKLVGPLYHIEKAINEIGSGQLNTNIKLRQKDQVVALANAINEMTAVLKRDRNAIKKTAADLHASINKMTDSPQKSELLEKKKHLDKTIEFFKV